MYSSFLLNYYDDLLRSMKSILKYFVSLLTNICRNYLILSRQFQNSMMLLESLLKNFFRFFNIVIEYNWYRWINISKIHLAVEIVSVMIIMWLTSGKWIVWLIPHLIAKSFASVKLILVVWWVILVMISLYSVWWENLCKFYPIHPVGQLIIQSLFGLLLEKRND